MTFPFYNITSYKIRDLWWDYKYMKTSIYCKFVPLHLLNFIILFFIYVIE